MKPIPFPESNIEIAKDQDEYQTLPAFVDQMYTVSLWSFTWKERLQILFKGRLWLLQMNFGQALQPQLPTLNSPFVSTEKEKE